MLPRLVIGQRNVDIDEYNARFERKRKHLCFNNSNSFSYFCNNYVCCCWEKSSDEFRSNQQQKKCTTCKFSSFSVFIVVIIVTLVLLFSHGTNNASSLISQTDSYSADNGEKVSKRDADMLKILISLTSEINKVSSTLTFSISNIFVFVTVFSFQRRKNEFGKIGESMNILYLRN